MDARLSTAVAPSAARARLVALAPFVVLGAWSLLVTVLLARHGLHNHYVFRDEAEEIFYGRDVAQHLSHAISGGVARGPERLTGLFAAVAALLFDSPTRQLEALHLWAAICQGLVTLPIWLAGRQLGLTRWQAVVPATLGSSGSFAFYGVLTLPTSVALLSAMLLLCALLKSLRRPGARADTLVIAALALLVLARIGWAPLVAALAPATLAACWLERPTGESLLAWSRALPLRLLRRHPLLVPLAVLLLLVALAKGPSQLLGGTYGGVRLKAHIVGSVLWDNTRLLGAHLAIGAALVPFVLALPALVRGLVRPREPIEGAFAWLLLGFVAIFSWAYYASMNEDRYFAVLAPPLILLGALAAFRRPPPLWSVALSGGLVTWLVASSYAWPTADVFTHFVAPTSQFFVDLPIGKLASLLPDVSHATLAALATAAAALAALLACRRRELGRAGAALAGAMLVCLLAYQLVAMNHAAAHFTDGVGMESLSVDQLEFIDDAAGGGSVRPLAPRGVLDPDLEAQLPFLRVYNTSLGGPFAVQLKGASGPIPAVAVDWSSGHTRVNDVLPALLLQMAGAAPVAFAGTTLPANPPFPWAQLVRPRLPLRATWLERGVQPDRYPGGGTLVRVRVFAAAVPARAHNCLAGQILAYPFLTRGVRYRLADGRSLRSGVVRPGTPIPFQLPLDGTRTTTATLGGEAATPSSDGVSRGPTLSGLSIARCAGR